MDGLMDGWVGGTVNVWMNGWFGEWMGWVNSAKTRRMLSVSTEQVK